MTSADDSVRRFFADPPIYYREAGDEDVADGPIPEDGWYVDPYCDPMCCRPTGPFASAEDARAWAWREHEVPEEMRVHEPVLEEPEDWAPPPVEEQTGEWLRFATVAWREEGDTLWQAACTNVSLEQCRAKLEAEGARIAEIRLVGRSGAAKASSVAQHGPPDPDFGMRLNRWRYVADQDRWRPPPEPPARSA